MTPAEAVPVYLHGPAYEVGEPRDIGELPELRDDPALLAALRGGGLAECAPGEASPAEMAAASARRSLWKARVEGEQVDALVYATSSFWCDRFIKRDVNELFRELGLSRAYPLGVTLSDCGNVVAALRVAAALVRGEGCANVLVAATDAVRPGAGRVVPPRVSVASDAAASFVVTDRPGGYRVLSVRNHMIAFAYEREPHEDFARYLKVSAEGIREVARAALEAAGRGAGELRRLLPNNYNRSVARLIASQAGVDEERVHTANIARLGHCFGADNVINLCDCAVEEPPAPGDLFLLLASGPNTWGAAVLEKV